MRKKLFTMLLLFTLSVVAVGCTTVQKTPNNNSADNKNENSSNTDESSQPVETSPEVTPEETPDTNYQIGNSAALKDWTITVTDAKIVDSIAADYGSFSPSGDGNKFIQVFVTVNNDGKQAASFLPSVSFGNAVSAKILYSDGYEFTATNLLGYSNDLHDATINPLSSQTGEIAFEIPNTVADAGDELLIQFSSGNDVVKFKIR